MSELRIAIVGFGKIARDQHVAAIEATDGVTLVAIVDSRAVHPGLPHFTTLDDLLRSDVSVDAVAICTPPQARGASTAAALAAGKHVLLEKPPGASISEVEALIPLAAQAGRTLFATWHSRFAPAVAPARQWLASRQIKSVRINWKEDVRFWHPKQRWIWEAGGLGVFDPGINALSILTHILPRPPFVTAARLSVPANCAMPIAARLSLRDSAGLPIEAEFDFRQTDPQSWDILAETDAGLLTLSGGGARLSVESEVAVGAMEGEYRGIYRRFIELVSTGASDVDLIPFQLVADAFMLGARETVEPFEE
jgi:D-galactose 1-dehydrogenase